MQAKGNPLRQQLSRPTVLAINLSFAMGVIGVAVFFLGTLSHTARPGPTNPPPEPRKAAKKLFVIGRCSVGDPLKVVQPLWKSADSVRVNSFPGFHRQVFMIHWPDPVHTARVAFVDGVLEVAREVVSTANPKTGLRHVEMWVVNRDARTPNEVVLDEPTSWSAQPLSPERTRDPRWQVDYELSLPAQEFNEIHH